jgi:hypothetical protein
VNRLASEPSPYLRQHASNPVDWFPWGDEAFARAAEEDRPVLLSIGYSACHWCHVMERESFADPEVAALLNAAFVCVKVDREERPDLDAFYMAVCQGMTGSGGWPLTLLLTPDRKPFFAATYLPKRARFGHLGLMELVPRVTELWRERRGEVLAAAERILEGLRAAPPAAQADPGEALLERGFRELKRAFDPARGGFGDAPKFPPAHALWFLLRRHRRHGSPDALAMVCRTLDAMRDGGIYDHLGGGFHRYATDAEWRVPHFEKMLYDQALLASAYAEAWQATGEGAYRETARATLDYLLRDLAAPGGGFFSSEDADIEGEEGRFYLWTRREVLDALGPEDGEVFCRWMNVAEEGNFSDPVTGRADGRNILFHGPGAGADPPGMESWRRKLFEARARRPRPGLDDKVLADWNGLAIAALALAGRALGEPRYIEAAGRAAAFVAASMTGPDGTLLHRWHGGRAGIPGFLDDYAFLAHGLIELHAATWDASHLRRALELTEAMLARFGDPAGGVLFLAAAGPDAPPVRTREVFDGSLPSGNSVAFDNLLRLAALTGRADLAERAWTLARAFAPQVERAPSGFCRFLSALDRALGPSVEVVVVGEWGAPGTRALLEPLERGFLPGVAALFKPAGDAAEVERLAPFTAPMAMVDGKAAAYLCSNGACGRAVADPAAMMDAITAALGDTA